MPDVSLERLLIMARRKTVSYEGWWRSVNWSVSSHIAAGGRALRQPALSVKPRGAGVPRVVAGLGSWPVCRSQSQERAGQTCSARLRCCCLNPNITERLFGNYQMSCSGSPQETRWHSQHRPCSKPGMGKREGTSMSRGRWPSPVMWRQGPSPAFSLMAAPKEGTVFPLL